MTAQERSQEIKERVLGEIGTVDEDSIEDAKDNDLVKEIRSTLNRPTKKDLYAYQTYPIRKDVMERLNKYAKKQPRGFKSELPSRLIEEFLNKVAPINK